MGLAETFSIRQMVELTGLSEFTIRGWENRYLAFQPQRTQTGRREYLKHDLERALLLRELLKRGHKISKVAPLGNRELLRIFEETNNARRMQSHEIRSDEVAKAIALMALQQWDELESLVRNYRAKDEKHLIRDFFLPILGALSTNVSAGLVSISQEHVLSSFLKERIYAVLSSLELRDSKSSSTAKFVLATPEGDHHEIGLLLANLMMRSNGFQTLYLGAHTPARDLAETALRFKATHLLIVATVSRRGGAKQNPLSYIAEVKKNIGENTQLLVAGRQAEVAEAPTTTLKFISDFESLESYLNNIRRRS